MFIGKICNSAVGRYVAFALRSPCLAFGTPVIFVDYGFKNEYDTCRLNGVTKLFNTIHIDSKENISANFHLNGRIASTTAVSNPNTFKDQANALRETCRNFINEVPAPV